MHGEKNFSRLYYDNEEEWFKAMGEYIAFNQEALEILIIINPKKSWLKKLLKL